MNDNKTCVCGKIFKAAKTFTDANFDRQDEKSDYFGQLQMYKSI